MKKYIWPVNIWSKTQTMSGKIVEINRTIEGACESAFALHQKILETVLKTRHHNEFIGCEIHAITPSGQKISKILEVFFGEYRLV